MTAIVIGLIFIVLGGLGILHWWTDFLMVLRGFGPISVFVGGVVALVVGIASFRPTRADESPKE